MDNTQIFEIIKNGGKTRLTDEERKLIKLELHDWCTIFSVPTKYEDVFIQWMMEVCTFDPNPRAQRNFVKIIHGTIMGRSHVLSMFDCYHEKFKRLGNTPDNPATGVDVDEPMINDPSWEKLRSINPEFIDKLLDLTMQVYDLDDDRTYFWFNTSNYNETTEIGKRVGHDAATLLIAVQSMTDVITNSSSELFVCSDPKADCHTIEHMLREYRESVEAGKYCSGNGGDLNVYHYDLGVFNNLVNELLFDGYYSRDEFTQEVWDECKLKWPISLLTDEELDEFLRIYKVFHGFPETGHLFYIDIDHNSRKTIEFIKTTMGGVRID